MNATPVTRIELRLRELAQLFNSLDPSPFHDRDLDAAAETFIVEWARESPAGREFELVIHLASPPPAERADGLEDAIHNYFQNRLLTSRSRLRRLFRQGRLSLLIGVLFLTFCLALSGLLGRLDDSAWLHTPRLVLDIVGWVALWRPLEIFLFDWWPVRDDIRIFARLARMRVRLILPA
jgi:hypothetical protein